MMKTFCNRFLAVVFAFAVSSDIANAAYAVYSGQDAVDKFQAAMPRTNINAFTVCNISNARWTTITNGVEYGFIQFSKLYGYKNDLHMLRIDYRKSNVKLKLVENTASNKRTSASLKSAGGVFGINGSFYNASTRVPSYCVKIDGTYLTSATSGGGIMFNDNAKKDWLTNLDFANLGVHYANMLGCECVLHNDVCALEGYPSNPWGENTAPTAGFPLHGMTKDEILYILVIDGRRTEMKGITYANAYKLLYACGCCEGFLQDGGGSTTLAIATKYLPSTKLSVRQADSSSSGIKLMNSPSDGSERAVLNSILFVPSAAAPALPDDSEAYYDCAKTWGRNAHGSRINLDYVPTSKTIIRSKFRPVTTATPQCLYSAGSTQASAATTNAYSFYNYTGGQSCFNFNNLRTFTGFSPGASWVRSVDFTTATNRVVFSSELNGTVDKTGSKNAKYSDFTADGPLTLFQSYTLANGVRTAYTDSSDVFFHRLSVSEPFGGSEVMKMNLVPRKHLGVMGLYDTVAKRFYPNEGDMEMVGPSVALIPPGSTLNVRGLPECYVADGMSIGYGLTTGLKNGDTLTISGPAEKVDLGGGARLDFIGWTLIQGGVTSSKGKTFTYTHDGSDAELVANWNVEYYLDARSMSPVRGTVSSVSGWYVSGTAISVTATPSAAMDARLVAWRGDTEGIADVAASTVLVTMDQPRTLRADFGHTLLEYIEFTKGAWVNTGIVPTNTEAEVVFDCEYVNNTYVFGTRDGYQYYELSMSGNYWRWSKYAATRAGNNVYGSCGGKWVAGKHNALFNRRGDGMVVIDGVEYESTAGTTVKSNQTYSATLQIGKCSNSPTDAVFTGKFYSIKLRDRSTGALLLNLVPCRRYGFDASEEVCFFDTVGNRYFGNEYPSRPFVAGPETAAKLEITGFPYEVPCQGDIYGERRAIAYGETVTLSAPAGVKTWNYGVTSQVTGWRLYEYDQLADTWTPHSSGSGTTCNFTRPARPMRLEWQWILGAADRACAYVMPAACGNANGSSWLDAYGDIQAAIDATPVGGTVVLAPGTYGGGETSYLGKADYLTMMRITKAISVLGAGGSDATVLDCSQVVPRNGAYVTASATLDGICISNGAYFAKSRNGGLEMNAGTARDIRIHLRDNYATSSLNLNATIGEVNAYDVVVDDSCGGRLITEPGNAALVQGAYGATLDGFTLVNGLYNAANAASPRVKIVGAKGKNAVLKHALVADNRIGITVNSTRANAVELTSYAEMENCTIANNYIAGPSAGLKIGGSTCTVRKSIVRGNQSATGAYGDVYNNTKSDGVWKDNPLFLGEANGDYRLSAASPCPDWGAFPVWNPSALACGYSFADGAFALYFNGAAPGATYVLDFGDGDMVSGSVGEDLVLHGYVPGVYTPVLTLSSGGNSVSYSDAGAAVIAPAVAYMRAGAGEGAYPYDTPSKATDNICLALSTGAAKVSVGQGTYLVPTPFAVLDREVEVVSEDGPFVTVFDSPSTDKSCNHSHFQLLHPGAVLSGFTLTGGHSDYSLYGYRDYLSLFINAGMVTNCIIRDIGQMSRSTVVEVAGTGRLVDCELDGRGIYNHNLSTYAGALYIVGNGLADRCNIHGFTVYGNYKEGTSLQGPVMLNSASAVLRNTLVTACTNDIPSKTAQTDLVKYGGVVQVSSNGGRIENCTVVGNCVGGEGAVKFFPKNATSPTAGALVNTIVSDNISRVDDGTGASNDVHIATAGTTVTCCCIGTEPGFTADSRLPMYMITSASPCAGTGLVDSWMEGASDLLGLSRLTSGTVSIGAYEPYTVKTSDRIVEFVQDGTAVAEGLYAPDAASAIAAVTIALPAGAGGVSESAYTGYFLRTATETSRGTGVWNVNVFGLDVETLDLDETLADLVAQLPLVSAESGVSATISAKPGLRYSILKSADVQGPYEEGTVVRASGDKVVLPLGSKPASGRAFYKVNVRR